MPKRKKLHKRHDDDEDLLEQREEHAEDAHDGIHSFTYGICDWCDIEHYLAELPFPYEAELCQFCIKKKFKEMEYLHNKLLLVASNSP